MKVPRYNYRQQLGPAFPELLADIGRMLADGNYVLSSEVTDFERGFADYLRVPHVCGLNSGTDALMHAFKALNIGPGDEVITHANTFHATVAAICLVGATPLLTDVEEDSCLPTAGHFDAAITPRTRAVVPVHLFGKPVGMNPIMDLVQKRRLLLIEDAAQAHGASVDGKRVGSFGDIACFSFHPSKNLAAAGDAGAVATSNSEIDQTLRTLRSLGQKNQNEHVAIGFNSKLDAIQARILSCKLPHLDQWNVRRREVAHQYRERLAGLPLAFQSTTPDEQHVYHLFQIRTVRRDELLAHLVADGIDAVVRYPTPIHLQRAFAQYGWRKGQFPVSERLAEQSLCLPIRPDLSEGEIDYVCASIKKYFG